MLKRDCLGHLKRAADANSVELAQQELNVAIDYMDEHHLNEGGYTSVLYTTPDEDIGFWYDNITACKKDLDTLPKDATQLERSNVLIKLRETLIDHGPSGDELTYPEGLAWYPYNAQLAILNGALLVIAGCSGLYILGEKED